MSPEPSNEGFLAHSAETLQFRVCAEGWLPWSNERFRQLQLDGHILQIPGYAQPIRFLGVTGRCHCQYES